MCPSKTIIKKVSRRSFLAAPALVLPSLTLARAETMLEGDGGANAPTGAPQFPMLLSNYAVRPPWQIAGVDYAVGPNANYGTSTAWKIPNGVTGGNTALPSGATLSGGNRIQISSANVTMNGWDLTQGAGQSLLVMNTPVGLVPLDVDYSDYRPVAGVKVPFHFTVMGGWEMTMELSAVQANAAVPAAKFVKPAGNATRGAAR